MLGLPFQRRGEKEVSFSSSGSFCCVLEEARASSLINIRGESGDEHCQSNVQGGAEAGGRACSRQKVEHFLLPATHSTSVQPNTRVTRSVAPSP